MNNTRLYRNQDNNGPSTFALLVDDISKMSEPEQKLLRIQLNEKKLSSFAQELDASVIPHNLSADDIDNLINEARNNGNDKKKG